MKKDVPKVVDLFSGAGGLGLGAARSGFELVGAVDNDHRALGAHEVNFGSSRHLRADVSKLSGHELAASLELGNEEIAGIIGGPPCQGFSNMGRRNRNDTRNQLFVDFFRIVNELKPWFFLAENVPGIMRPSNRSIIDNAIGEVSDDYEVLAPMKITASDYGAPTKRTRMFFFGYLPDQMSRLTENSFKPPHDAETVRVKYALNGLVEDVDPSWQKEADGWRVSGCKSRGFFASRLHGHLPKGVGDPIALWRLKNECKSSGTLGTFHSDDVMKRYAALGPGEIDRVSRSQRLDPEGFCPTLRAGTGPDMGSYQAVRPIHPEKARVITPREAARLQGFPDWFTFSPSKWQSFRQIGSSVSPIVAEHLMSKVRSSLDR